ncbi:MAG: DHH family phosphoesterase [Butyrivibrio sp.]|nr:DHH family phosphoesterase [Butyrivibrio sp.]
MKLSALLDYKNIVIQCHDNPDADAICSGYALFRYFQSFGKKVRFIYSGNFKISKSNLVFLIDELGIPIEFVSNLKAKPDLLIMTDCQYGEGNVRKFPAKEIAVIDHHQVYGNLPKLNEVRSNLGSCCSVIWNLLRIEANENIVDSKLATALFYGLYSDTNAFSEMYHPLDRDMLDALQYDKELILKLKNMNLTLKEARIAGVAMLGIEYHPEFHYAILRTDPCDPNLLGLIGDFIVAVDTIDICLVYSILSFGVKYSIRSCSNETRADELSAFLAQKIGSGGGHTDKAGGILRNELIKKQYNDYVEIDEDSANHSISNIIRERMADYFENSEIIRARETELDIANMNKYERTPITLGFVEAYPNIPVGNMAIIRTLDGDNNIEIRKNTILIIDNNGNVTAISREKFEYSYKTSRKKFKPVIDYTPTVKNADTGRSIPLLPLAKSCESTSDIKIYAKKLQKTTKLFPYWDSERYMLGQKGDYIAVSQDDIHDIFIIEKNVFSKTYKAVK